MVPIGSVRAKEFSRVARSFLQVEGVALSCDGGAAGGAGGQQWVQGVGLDTWRFSTFAGESSAAVGRWSGWGSGERSELEI